MVSRDRKGKEKLFLKICGLSSKGEKREREKERDNPGNRLNTREPMMFTPGEERWRDGENR